MSEMPPALPEKSTLLVVGLSGDVLHYTDGAESWLDGTRALLLAQLTRELLALGISVTSRVIDGVRVNIHRLQGARPAFLITVLPTAAVDPLASLTPRQREIAAIAATGATAIEIGKVVALSPATVRVHIRDIYARLGIGKRVELANLTNGRV